ncbi:DNA repair protein endonuclease SAE2/CtIP C-terminus-domain-containing protein [Gymnopilus junonius]|uniref:DNA repair protein endonuclease SAE2/CtIP C-terminus-domain-containing protein n=1 Tax=Gymnopilus junonius TaxID=109634 RepID=A0A9P5TN21_GYMJU|nr:DNA repair protein endonuclease SAE2/CtIP C-terminus-domain-containing protein [Gymnopilus junonius]
MTSTYSSSSLRERDQIIHEKYKKEIKDLETKIQRIKYTADETSKNLFDAQNRGRRLAGSLGFHDTYDAQVAIDSSDSNLTYRECLDRLRETEANLAFEKKEVLLLRFKLRNVERENKRLALEKRELEERYDDLRDRKFRATEHFKKDYQKWKHEDVAKAFGKTAQELFGEELPKKQKRAFELSGGPNLTDDYFPASLLTSPRKPAPSVTPGPGASTDDKENEGTPASERKTLKPQPASSVAPSQSPLSSAKATSRVPLRDSPLSSVTNVVAPSSSPTVFLTSLTTAAAKAPTAASTTRAPLSFKPITPPRVTNKSYYTVSPINTKPNDTLLSSSPSIPRRLNYSSETEDDSQVPAPPPKADTSRLVNSALNTPQSDLSSRPLLTQSEPGPKRSLPLKPVPLSDHDRESGRPAKMRRISDSGYDRSANSSATTASSNSTSEPRPRTTEIISTRKGKERENMDDTATPLTRNKGQKRLDDYSVFKGRGRYGKDAQDQNKTTINALFTIDPAQNGGVPYQYDEVVRSKEARRKMDAGDCECCREYYENVGPLPSRLQAPLWRSPTSSPARSCPHHPAKNNGVDMNNRTSPSASRAARRRSDIESHKKAISRHRHTWARAATPPGYWEIGFPNTQQVLGINEKAKEMHQRKKDQIEREAEREGTRYRKK